MNANAETSRATGSRDGGIRAYWIAEGEQMTASKVKLRQMKLEPQQLAVFAYVTDKLLRNAPALNAYLTRAAVDEINFTVGDAIIRGDGVGKPLGILNSGAVVEVEKETGQAAASLRIQNIHNMWSRCHPVARRNAVWFYNQTIEPKLLSLTLDAGTAGTPVYMPPGGLSAAPYGTILGLPAIPLEYASEAGALGDIMLLNLGYYATGTTGGVDSAASIHLRFDYNETAFRFLFAVDGRSWLVSPITPYKGETLSPFVVLKARA
jgi:HK97 family phage major capsid protein